MRVLDRTQPALLGSLHNAELGGAYYYLTRPEPRWTRCSRAS